MVAWPHALEEILVVGNMWWSPHGRQEAESKERTSDQV
jgi:hypothetical protein